MYRKSMPELLTRPLPTSQPKMKEEVEVSRVDSNREGSINISQIIRDDEFDPGETKLNLGYTAYPNGTVGEGRAPVPVQGVIFND